MAKRVEAIPDGYHTVTPYLTVRGADQAITFYKNAFGAEELMRMPGPDGKSIMHAEIKIGDSPIFLSEEFPEMGCRSPQSLGAQPARFISTSRTLTPPSSEPSRPAPR